MEENIVQKIHDSDIFGTIVELGAGNPLSYQLFEVSGASATIYEALSPYNKQAQLDTFFGEYSEIKIPRSVSEDFVDMVVTNRRMNLCDKDNLPDNHNMFFISSFQIGEDICNHGWIAYEYKDTYRLYHLTLPNGTRANVIREIGKVGLQILLNKNKNKAIPYCDILIDSSMGIIHEHHQMPVQSLANLNSLEPTCHFSIEDQILTFNRDGSMCRLETILREGSQVIHPTIPIYKGSFNPPHKVHLDIAKSVSGRLHHQTIFMISLDTYSKANVDPTDIYKRIKILNRLGHHVIVNRDGKYNNAIDLVQERTDRELVWVAGGDTINRLADMTDPNIEQPVLTADFIAFKRPTVEMNDNLPFGNVIIQDVVNETNINSTEIRSMLSDIETNKDVLKEWLSYDPEWLK